MSGPPLPAAVTLGTRASALARVQTELVIGLLAAARPGLECATKVVTTAGDRTQASGEPLPEIGGKGLFTEALEQALRDGEIDLAVHSLKDLPTEDPEGAVVAAVTRREDVRDCLVARDGGTLAELAPARSWGRAACAALRSSARSVPTSRSARSEGTSTRGCARSWTASSTLPCSQPRACDGSASRTRSPNGSRRRRCSPHPDRGHWRFSAGPMITRSAYFSPSSTIRRHVRRRRPSASFSAPLEAAARLPWRRLAVTTTTPRVRLQGLVAAVDGAEVVRVRGEGEPRELGERLADHALAGGADRILAAIRG